MLLVFTRAVMGRRAGRGECQNRSFKKLKSSARARKIALSFLSIWRGRIRAVPPRPASFLLADLDEKRHSSARNWILIKNGAALHSRPRLSSMSIEHIIVLSCARNDNFPLHCLKLIARNNVYLFLLSLSHRVANLLS